MKYFFTELNLPNMKGRQHKSIEDSTYCDEPCVIIRYYALPVLVLPGMRVKDILIRMGFLIDMVNLAERISFVIKPEI